jgi:hypothetical protein
MKEGIWPLILDGTILVLLAATVVLAARLSLQLKDFRESRKSMEGLVKDLATHVDKAQRAIEGLKEGVKDAGRELQNRISAAQALADELQIMTESGNKLAGRLEQLADKHIGKTPAVSYDTNRNGSFAIRDRELAGDMGADGIFNGEEDEEDEAVEFSGFSSRAEQELYEALRKGRK